MRGDTFTLVDRTQLGNLEAGGVVGQESSAVDAPAKGRWLLDERVRAPKASLNSRSV